MNPFAVLLICLLLCSACTGPSKALSFSAGDESLASIYLINHGKHAGLVVRRADIPPGIWPESRDFPDADYLELGWGDWDYYQTDDPGLWLTLKAAFWSTASVLHVVGVKGSVADRFAGYEVIRLELAPGGFAKLVDYIHQSFARNGETKARPIGPGYGLGSRFYPARGKFHLYNTCNGWVARALEAAGYPMGVFRPVTADQLMAKARQFAAQ
ncbi:DUF2459 domain-containing protein [Methylobacter svalbardensis]|uniref:DUF2459 domain-containing protein n=1 Tax=Methylobacter svalbardensis TaxID=3080016 RepID=UPI0030ED0CE7